MARRTENTLLRAVTRELAAAIDRGDVPRNHRAEARRLLLRAWQATEARGADAPSPAELRVLSRRIDALLAGPAPEPTSMPTVRVPNAAPFLAERESPLASRIQARVAAADALVERTRVMVEKAVATAAATTHKGAPRAPGESADSARTDLELVRGDAERAPGARRRRNQGATFS